MKTKSLKSRKIDIFPRGLTHGLGPKMAIFPNFFFRQYSPGICLSRYFRNKKPFLGYKKKNFKKSKKLHFSKGVNSWFRSKNNHFSKLFFFGNIGQENVFDDILEIKNPFQNIKTRSSKSRKIDIFPKGLTHGFGPKMAIFPNSFFQAIQPRKMSFTIFQNIKKPFYAIKKRSSKSRKIDLFPKGLTYGFGPKMAIFPNVFFSGNIGQENVFNQILEQK